MPSSSVASAGRTRKARVQPVCAAARLASIIFPAAGGPGTIPRGRQLLSGVGMGVLDRFGRSLFVAAAVGLAWGIRGDYGHVVGAMYPGAVLGLAWVAVSGSPALVPRMPVIAAMTAGAIGAGGTMSYGVLHGYAQADT